MSTFHLKHSGVVFLVAINDKFFTTRDTAIIHITINSTFGVIGGDVIATESARWHPACHSNFQNSQPALFEVQATAEERVNGFGLA